MLGIRTQATATLDDKGRLSLPAPLRHRLQDRRLNSLVLCCFQGSIWGWTPEDYERNVEARMDGTDPFNTEVLDFVHGVLAMTEEVDLDRSGRIRVPPELRELAGLDKEVKVFSVLDRIEIWDMTRWKERFQAAQSAAAGLGGMPRRLEA